MSRVGYVRIEVQVDDSQVQRLESSVQQLKTEMMALMATNKTFQQTAMGINKETAQLAAQVEKLKGKYQGQAETITRLAAENRKLERSLERVKNAQKTVSEETQTQTEKTKGLNASFKGLASTMARVWIVSQTIKHVGQILSEGAQTLDMQRRLEGTVEGFDALAKRAQLASGYMLSHEQMLRSLSLMKSFGIDISNADRIMGTLSKTAINTGQSMDYMLDSFARGVARQSPLILDNLGIQISLKDVYEEYAKNIGKATDELTKNEKMTAVLNATLKQLEKNTSGIDLLNTTSSRVGRGLTAWEDLLAGIKEQFALATAGVVDFFDEAGSRQRELAGQANLLGLVSSGVNTVNNAVNKWREDGGWGRFVFEADAQLERSLRIVKETQEATQFVSSKTPKDVFIPGSAEVIVAQRKAIADGMAAEVVRIQEAFEGAAIKGLSAGVQSKLRDIVEKEIPQARDALLKAFLTSPDDERLKAMSVTADLVIAILERRKEQLLVEERINQATNVGQRLLEGVHRARLANASLLEEKAFEEYRLQEASLLAAQGKTMEEIALIQLKDTELRLAKALGKQEDETNDHYTTRLAVMKRLTGLDFAKIREDMAREQRILEDIVAAARKKGRKGAGGEAPDEEWLNLSKKKAEKWDKRGADRRAERMIRDFFRAGDYLDEQMTLIEKSGLLEQMISLRQTLASGKGLGLDELTTLFEKFAKTNEDLHKIGSDIGFFITPADDALLQTMRQRIEATQFWHDTLEAAADSLGRVNSLTSDMVAPEVTEGFGGLQSAISGIAAALKTQYDAMTLVEAALPGMEQFTKSLIKDQQTQALVLGLMEAAAAAASYATYNYPAGIAHTAAAVLYGLVAGKAFPAPPGAKSSKKKDSGGGGDSGGSKTINIHMGGSVLMTEAERGDSVRRMLDEARRHGFYE